MSATITPAGTKPIVAPGVPSMPSIPVEQDPMQKDNNSLLSQQFVMGMYLLTIVAGILAAVVYRGDAAQINLVLGFAFPAAGAVYGFYYGTSKSSQNKDTVMAAKIPNAAP